MKLIAPKNVFTKILAEAIGRNEFEVFFCEASLVSKELEYNTSAVALIPSLDLINHRELFVSSKVAISFDGMLSNSYLYFKESERDLEKIAVRGDVSLNEVILTKILFSERFSSNAEIVLEPSSKPTKEKDYIIVGDENFSAWNFKNGISFSDEVSEMLDFPYVNFVFVSPDKDSLNSFHKLVGQIDETIEDKIDTILPNLNLPDEAKSFIKENLDSLYYQMTSNETEALNDLIRLLFYHGIIEDLFDVKFV